MYYGEATLASDSFAPHCHLVSLIACGHFSGALTNSKQVTVNATLCFYKGNNNMSLEYWVQTLTFLQMSTHQKAAISPFFGSLSVLRNRWIIQFRELQNYDYNFHHDGSRFLHHTYHAHLYFIYIQLVHRYMSSVHIWSYPKCSAQQLIASHIYAYVWGRIDRSVNCLQVWLLHLSAIKWRRLSNTCASPRR